MVLSTNTPVPGDVPTTATVYTQGPFAATGTLLVLAHGAGAGQQHPFMVAVSEAIASRGIDVVTFDFPYKHAGRKVPDRQPALEACFEHVLSWAVNRGRARGVRRTYIGGKSMGGRIAAHLGARRVAGIDGIVALGYPLRPPGRTPRDRVAHLALIHQPLLVVQGTRDAFGTPDDIREATATTPGPTKVVAVEGADHSFSVRGRAPREVLDGVGDTVASWIASLGGGPAS